MATDRLLAVGLLVLAACSTASGARSAPPGAGAAVGRGHGTESTTTIGFDPVTTSPAPSGSTGGFDPVTTTATTPPGPATTARPSTADPDEQLLGQLVVAPEHQGGYARDRFHHWIDADHDGCNTRCEVLEDERRPDVGWVSIYDGVVTNDPDQLQIDHVVALAEAWRSGAWAWDDARREAYANDLDLPDALIAVSAKSNESKGDKDPAEWRPPNRGAWCKWGRAWATVKVKWGLTVDATELSALESVLTGC